MEPQHTYLMLDLETLSTQPTAMVMAIGAVLFTETDILGQFSANVAIEGQLDYGAHISSDTLHWWLGRPDAQRQALIDTPCVSIRGALDDLSDFVARHADPQSVQVWGNGAGFDLPILKWHYGRNEMTQPWEYYNERCYRTLKADLPHIKLERASEHHVAVNDALNQARHLQAMLAYKRAMRTVMADPQKEAATLAFG